jgi:hypothetical protein
MTAADIIRATTITAVWVGLGGDPPVHNRARAFYRNGDNPQAVLLDDAKGRWFDFRDNFGGGVLDLVQKVRSVSRSEALYWVADFIAASLDKEPPSRHSRRRFAALKQHAEQLAHECLWWARAYAAAMERTKAEAFEREDIATLVRAARELNCLRNSPSSEILAKYVKARNDSPNEVAALVEWGRKDEEDAVPITANIVILLEKSQREDHA